MNTGYRLYMRRGTLINTDPQRRCYNGAYFSSYMEWSPWELWIKDLIYSTKKAADHTAKLFCREDQQVKAFPIEQTH